MSLSAFGPRLHAHVAVLAGVCRLSREKIVELLGECYGIELSTGAVDGMLRRVSRVLHDPWRELHEAIKLAEAVHADETTWLCKADPCWLWTATTAALVCYRIDRECRRNRVSVIERTGHAIHIHSSRSDFLFERGAERARRASTAIRNRRAARGVARTAGWAGGR